MLTTVTVTTAVNLSAKQMATLSDALTKSVGDVEITNVVDPTVIGGLKIRIGSEEYDATIAQKLRSIKDQLIALW